MKIFIVQTPLKSLKEKMGRGSTFLIENYSFENQKKNIENFKGFLEEVKLGKLFEKISFYK